MDSSVRQLVCARVGDRCEYCRLPQSEGLGVRFHVEHIRPRQHGGGGDPENLALACPTCNRNKGSNLTAVDPDTDRVERLFDPRVERWAEHFALIGAEIIGLTSVGRATARLMRMNDPERVQIRRELIDRGVLGVNE